jgi:hypothetical protein
MGLGAAYRVSCLHEPKHDGWRVAAIIDGRGGRLRDVAVDGIDP